MSSNSTTESKPFHLPKVGVVVLNWNGWKDTVELIDSLNSTSYRSLYVVIIDNASTDESLEQIKARLWDIQSDFTLAHYDAVHGVSYLSSDPGLAMANDQKHYLLVESAANLGFCAGNNLGMQLGAELGAEYLLVLNNDTLVAPDFLEPMVEVAEHDESVGLVGGIITYCEKPDTIWWAGGVFDRFLNNRRLLDRELLGALEQQFPYETEWISGCMMMIPIRIYTQFGGYAEEYFIWSEEWDYSLRVSKAGYKLVVAPRTRICHKVGRSLGVMKPLSYYYGIRNGLLFKRKYLPKYLWYPYLLYYLLNRAARCTQLTLQGRGDLAHTGVAAIFDFFAGVTGQWRRQQT